MNLVMGKHDIEEGGERGIRPAHRASTKNWTSVAALSTEAQDAGQAAVLPHSLKLVASARRTLSMASSLSTRDRPMAGSTAKGGLAEDRGFFPFSIRFGAMAMERTELRSDGEEAEVRRSGGVGECVASKGEITVWDSVAT